MKSQNYSRRSHDITGVIIHYTGSGSSAGSIRWMCNPNSKVSAHYIISRKGNISCLVDPANKAWHAGCGSIEHNDEQIKDVNSATIGIELANCGRLFKKQDRFYYKIGKAEIIYTGLPPIEAVLYFRENGTEISGYWEPYPMDQIHALRSLIDRLCRDYPQACRNLLGHEEVALPVGRKTDPGPLFPWSFFYRSSPQKTIRTLLYPLKKPIY